MKLIWPYGVHKLSRSVQCFAGALLLVAFGLPAAGQMTITPSIFTVAGNGTFGHAGDNGAATSAELYFPLAILPDVYGNLYIADSTNDTVRKVSSSGIITTIAGIVGEAGYNGDNRAATTAWLDQPTGLALDSAGNLYIADTMNGRIRKVSTTGTITTVAGTGAISYNGDNIAATSASIYQPRSIVFDASGNLYIADTGNSRVRKVDTGGTITTVAGTATAGYNGDSITATTAELNGPHWVAFDGAGNLYIADTTNNRVRKVSTGGTITTVAGNGTAGYNGDSIAATSAELNNPWSVAVDSLGNLYISDTYNYRIRKVNAAGTISTVAGNGTSGYNGDGIAATSAELYTQTGIAVDSYGNIYIADSANQRIREVTSPTNLNLPTTALGSSATVENILLVTTATETITSISVPVSQGNKQEFSVGTITGCTLGVSNAIGTICTVPITFTPAYTGLRQVPLQVVTSTGKVSFGLTGMGAGPQIALVPGIITTVAGNGTAGYTGDNGAATSAELDGPFGVAVDAASNLYIADEYNNVIRKVDTSGTITTIAGNGYGAGSILGSPPSFVGGYSGDNGPATSAEMYYPGAVTVDAAGNLFITDCFNYVIRKVNANGIITTVAGTGSSGYNGDNIAATSAKLNSPDGTALDAASNLYIADKQNNRIRKVNTSGIITTVAGNGTQGYSGDNGAATSAELNNPSGVTVDAVGNLYIADYFNFRIRKVDTNGIITTVAGTGTAGYSGDNGAATSAELSYPSGVAVDPAGNLYIADYANGRIRKVDTSGTITTIAGDSVRGYAGDNGPATNAELFYPSTVAMDGAGNLYIADYYLKRIRKINVTQSQLNYTTSTQVGQTDSTDGAQTVTVANIGNAAGAIAVPGSGNNPSIASGFLYDAASTCPQLSTAGSAYSLASGAACTYGVDFQPVSVGSNAGSLILTDNSLNTTGSTQTVSLNGTGLAITVTKLAFGTSPATPISASGNAGPAVTVIEESASSSTATTASDTITLTVTGPSSYSHVYTVSAVSGVATFNLSSIALANPGSYLYTATLSGVTSATATEVVNTISTTTSVTANVNPQVVGSAVTLTATVVPASTITPGPSGTVSFYESGFIISSTSLALVSGNYQATTLVSLALGSHNLTAVYSGDSNYAGSTSGIYTEVIEAPVAPTISFTVANQSYGTAPFGVAATSNSNGAFTYSVTSGPATISGSTVTLTGAGTVTLLASEAAGGVYSTGTKSANFTVSAGTTTTTLAVTNLTGTPETSVSSGTAIKLTATVKIGSVTPTEGTVYFCNALATHCTDINQLGTAQLNSSGIAVLSLKPGVGSHSYKAIYVATNNGLTSTSATSTLVVGTTFPSTVSISHSGSAGNYTLSATVTGTGSAAAPTGTVNFYDQTNGDYTLGSGTVTASGTVGLSYSSPTSPTLGSGPDGPIGVGDLNGDGIPDFAVANYVSDTVSVYLGNGDGTFTLASSPTVGSGPIAVSIGDFNGDGIPDLAVANELNHSVTILLGYGDGTYYVGSTLTTAGTTQPLFVAVGDFNGDGIQDLAIADHDSPNGTVTIFLGNGDGTFTEKGTVAVGLLPTSIAVGDFNGDGNQDLAVTNLNSASVSILLGNGDGTFTLSSSPTVGSNPQAIVTGDFNGDGVLDLAVVNYIGGSVSVFLGNGSGGFTLKQTPTVGAGPRGIAITDVNGDGIPDLAVANTGGNSITLLRGNGDGTFTAYGSTVSTGTNTTPEEVAVADLNGDGIPDLITDNNFTGNATILLARWTYTATASLSSVSPVGTGSHNIYSAYSGDSNYASSTSASPTVLTAQKVTTSLTLSPNQTTSGPGQSASFTATLAPNTAQGHLTDGESITLKSGTTTVGTGTLSGGVATITTTTLPAGNDDLTAVYAGDGYFNNYTSSIVPYDVTSATTTTLAVTASAAPVTTVMSGTVVTLTATVKSGGSAVTTGLVDFCDATATHCTDVHLLGTAQLTSSGTASILFRPGVGSHSYKAIFVATNADGTSTSSSASLAVTLSAPLATTTALAATGSVGNYTLTATVTGTSESLTPTGSISILDTSNSNYLLTTAILGTATSTLSFSAPTNVTVGTSPNAIVTGDFNNDGIPDVAVVNGTTQSVSIFLGNGDGSFTAMPSLSVTTALYVVAGDFNGDGKLDLAVTGYYSNVVSIYLGNGDGTFTLKSTVATAASNEAIAVGDFNGDGIPDLAVVNKNAGIGVVEIYLGNGDGTFTAASSSPATGTSPAAIAVGDFLGNGKLDIAVANVGSNPFSPGTMTILLGNGDGTFTTSAQSLATGNNPGSVVVADFNGDGIPDLAVANLSSNSISILLGNGDGTFTADATSPSGGGLPYQLAVADFNGDGKADLAVTNSATNGASVLLGNGDGTFQSAVATPSNGDNSSYPWAIAVADFNGDGVPDIGVVNGNPIPIASTTYYASFYLTDWTQTATAVATGVSVAGTGSHFVNANYSGNSNFAASTSSNLSLTAQQAVTTLVISASPSGSSTSGQSVTLTATLSPLSAQGHTTNGDTINFFVGGSALGGSALSGGVATLATTLLPTGSDTLTATYAGDTNFASSSSNNLSYTVNAAPIATTTTLGSSANPASYGQSVTFTATVTQASGVITPTGTVQFSVNGSAVGSAVTLVSGIATYATSTLALGTDSVTAVYTPTGNFVTSSATALSQVVNQASQTITFGSLANKLTTDPPFAVSATDSSLLPVDFYTTSTGSFSWAAGAVMPTAIQAPMVGAPGDGNIYIVGGRSQTSAELNTVVQYNPQTNTWAAMANKPTAAMGGTAASIGGILYVAGGWGPAVPSNVLEAYNPLTNSWSSKTSMSHLSACSASGVINNKMYVFTPCNGFSGYYAFLDVYDPVANSWTSLANAPNAHGNGAGGAINGKFYIAGGYNSSGTLISTLDVYDPATGWSTKASMPVALAGASADVINGQLYVVGGYDGTNYRNTVNVYDPISNTWGTQTSLPSTLAYEAVVAQNGMLYIAGGANSGSNYLNTSEILSHADVCTNLGSTVTLTGGVGTCSVTAYQPGNANYTAATPITQSFTVSLPVNKLAFGTAPATPIYVGGNAGTAVTVLEENSSGTTITTATDSITLTVTGPSSYSQTYNATAVAGVATFNLGSIALNTAGSYLYTATLSGVTSATSTEVVNLLDPGIIFAVPNHTYGDAPFTVAAASNSTGAYTYSVVSGPATISGATVTLTGVGTVVLQVSQVAQGIYAAATQNATFTVAQEGQTISFTPIPTPQTFGVGAITLSASATSGLTVSFSILSGPASVVGNTLTITGAGTFVVAANQAGNTNYLAATQMTQTIVVNKATPIITWATPSFITYGTPLSTTQLNAAASVAGSYVYSPASGTVLTAGGYTLSVTFTPTDTADYNTATDSVLLTVVKATPTITWSNPAAITYGTPLGATQLNASASAAGSLNYSPIAGTVLGAGNQTLTVAFAPADPGNYNTQTATVTLVVNKATPTITWSNPSAITYGTVLSVTQLNATASVPGSLVYSPASGTLLTAGAQSLSVTFTPTDTTDYTTQTANVTLTVNKATPTITWSNPSAITYGTALSATQLNATASVPGSFVYSPASGTVLTAGTQTLSVTFTPTDTTDYTTQTANVSLTVNKATPTITWNNPTAITYGTALSATQLNATASVPGSFVYSPASGTVLAAGTQSLAVTFTPTDTTDYTTQSANVSLTVSKAAPTITWSNPSAITYGTALSATQLNATASVPGSFVYSPISGAVLAAGTQTLNVTFTPTDTTDYTTQTKSVSLTVNQVTPTITWNNPSAIPYGTALSATQLNATASVPGSFVYNPVSGTVLTAGVHSLSVTFTPTDTTDYTTQTFSVSLTVSKVTPTVSWSNPASITYGTALSGTQLNATASVPGSFVYSPASGAVLTAGTQTLSVTFTPTDTTDYNNQIASVQLIVSKVTPTISWSNPSAITYGTVLSATQLNATASVPGSFVYSPASGVLLTAGTQTLSVTFTPTDTTDYNTQIKTVTLLVNQATPIITWSNPSAINYGTTLSATQLNASASVPGGLVYTPVLGTLLGVGSQTLSVSFTPTDAVDYTTQSKTVTLVVNQATPLITWTAPTAITYGAALSATQLNASSTVAGNLNYTPALGTVLGAGVQTLSVTLTPTDAIDYTTATKTVGLTVNQAAQTINFTPIATPVPYGTLPVPLVASGGASGNPITYSATGPATLSSNLLTYTGAGAVTVTANQAGNANYLAATAITQTIVVSKASETISSTVTQPDLVAFGQSSSIPVTVTGQFAGAGIAIPTGAINYSITKGVFSQVGTLTLVSAAASIPVSNSLSPGVYSVVVNYNGDSDYSASSTPLILTLQIGPILPTIQWTAPGTVVYGTTLNGLLNATAVYNSNAIAGSYIYTAKPAGASAFVVTNTTLLSPGNYTLGVSFTPTDPTTYQSATGTVTLTVTQASSTIALSTTLNPAFIQNQIVLTATVTTSVSQATGTVSFYDGAALIGTSGLATGKAVISTSSLTFGPHLIAAVYNGDANFLTSTSNTITEQMQDFALSVEPNSSATAIIQLNQTASYSLAITPLNGATFPSDVAFSVSGAPIGSIVTISPTTASFGQGATPFTVKIAIGYLSDNNKMPSPLRRVAPVALALLLLPFLGRTRRKLTRSLRVVLLLVAGFGLVSGLSGCGYHESVHLTLPITVTATSGQLNHSISLTLKVD